MFNHVLAEDLTSGPAGPRGLDCGSPEPASQSQPPLCCLPAQAHTIHDRQAGPSANQSSLPISQLEQPSRCVNHSETSRLCQDMELFLIKKNGGCCWLWKWRYYLTNGHLKSCFEWSAAVLPGCCVCSSAGCPDPQEGTAVLCIRKSGR